MNAQDTTGKLPRMRETEATLKMIVPDGFTEADVQKAVELLVKAGTTAALAALKSPTMAQAARWPACVKVNQILVRQRRVGKSFA